MHLKEESSLYTSMSKNSEDNCDPWEYLDSNSSKFIPNLLLLAIQKEQYSTLRCEVVNKLAEYFQIPNYLKYLRGAFSKEGVRLLQCLFKSEKHYLVADALRLFQILFSTHRDAFLEELLRSVVFYDVMRLLWNENYFGDICNLLRVFIQEGSRSNVVQIFRYFEVLEKLCESARIKLAQNNIDFQRPRIQELEIIEMFLRRMVNHNTDGYLHWIRVAREYGY